MITSLHIHNIALIEDLVLEFGYGLHVLSGETGAGKSIVVDAVNLVLGGRADRDLIRTGTEKAWVEAVFDVHGNPEVAGMLNEEEIEWDSQTVILYRDISRTGRNLCRVCGVVTQLSFYRDLAGLLMDVHGQHEHRFLMDSRYHLGYLDASGGEEHKKLMESVRVACREFLACHRTYVHLSKENERKEQRMGILKQALSELQKAKLKPGEEAELLKEQEKLRNSAKIISALQTAYSRISLGEEGSMLASLKAAMKSLETISELSEKYQELYRQTSSAYYDLEDVGFELSGILEKGEFDPGRAEAVDQRIDLIRRMERKYGGSEEEVLATQEAYQKEFDDLMELDTSISKAADEHRRLLGEYRHQARLLTESRKSLAEVFEQKMMGQLKDLGMAKTVFQVVFSKPERQQLPTVDGEDLVEFQMSANPGEPLKPMSKIASGGELSRIMLALKTLEAERGGVESMVFDEIDTGISGKIAQTVAEKMAQIAVHRQVICVTHLAQIVAMADRDYLVEKTEHDGRTNTNVLFLSEKERISEVARMLAGADGADESALSHAEHMLRSAAQFKNGCRTRE